MGRTLLGVGLIAVALCAAPMPANAAKPCQAIEWNGDKIKIGVISVPCAEARETIFEFYERWEPELGYYPVAIDRLRCTAASAGTDVACHRGDDWIFATSRPYADITEYRPPRKPRRAKVHRVCGPLLPDGIGAYSYTETWGIRCTPANRIAFRARQRFCKRHGDCLINPPVSIRQVFEGRTRYRGWQCKVKVGWELTRVHCHKRGMRLIHRSAA